MFIFLFFTLSRLWTLGFGLVKTFALDRLDGVLSLSTQDKSIRNKTMYRRKRHFTIVQDSRVRKLLNLCVSGCKTTLDYRTSIQDLFDVDTPSLFGLKDVFRRTLL